MVEHLQNCTFCSSSGGETLWTNTLCRVVFIADPDYTGYCRVILNRHEREMSDLDEHERHELMRVVFAVETALRRLLGPDKINLASLGNMTPHVHWHVIPRWKEDCCFPNPIWGSELRTGTPAHCDFDPSRIKEALHSLLGHSLPESTRGHP